MSTVATTTPPQNSRAQRAVAMHLARLGRHLALLGMKAEASVAVRLAEELGRTLEPVDDPAGPGSVVEFIAKRPA